MRTRAGDGEGRWSAPHTKLVPPRLPGNFVPRRELRDELTRAVAAADVTLVCAPAGHGKTLLLADWFAAPRRDAAAWVSLDPDDDGAEHFLAALLSAIGEYLPDPVSAALPAVHPPGGDVATAVAELLDAVDALPGRLVLVLDNVQEVPGRGALDVLATVIRHQPRNLRLLLASRSDPPLPLARLRVQGRLVELRADSLRFGQAHARELLGRSGVDLTDDQVARLVSQTDGWVAGLRLAARSLRAGGDPEDFLPQCAGHDHAMADFLAVEVLARLPEDTRDALTTLSVCEAVTPPLATALTGRDDAAEVLAGLEDDGVLVTAVDGDELRYQLHPMLRAYLRAELTRRRPDLKPRLHDIAARWFAARDRPREALRHAEQTADPRAATALLDDHGVDMLLDGHSGLVLRALDAADPAGRPRQLLCSALAHLELGDLGAAESDIARGARGWPAGADERLDALRRLVVSAHAMACGRAPVRGAVGVSGSAAVEAWERLDEGMTLLAAGDRDGARRELDAAARLGDEQNLYYVLVHVHAARALLAAVTGDHTGMVRAAERALALAGDGAWKRSPWLGVCHAVLGFARLLQGDPREARRYAAELTGSEAPMLRFAAAVVDAVARFDLGERVTALHLLHEARAALADTPVPRELAAAAMVLEHQCAVSLARFPLARDVAEWGGRRAGATAEVHGVAARARFARGDVEGAGRALRAARAAPRLAPGTDVGLCLLDAAVALDLGCRTKAREALGRALALAAPGRIVRPFANVEPELRPLLLDQLGGFAGGFATRVRDALTPAAGGTASPVLTGRERAVLVRLTEPQPLDEVAADLSVSVNTVKTHVRAIYAKLGVNNRRAAAAAARELGLG